MKKILLVFFIYTLLCFGCALAKATDDVSTQDMLLGEAFQVLSVDELNGLIDTINHDTATALPPLDLASIKEIAFQGGYFDIAKIATFIIKKLFEEVVVQMGFMGKLLVLAVMCALLQNLQTAFARSDIALLAYSVCFCCLAGLAMKAFYEAVQMALKTIVLMSSFMEALLPLLITLLAGVGALTSAALFSPLMLFVVSSVAAVVKMVVLPLLLCGAALECTNYLSEHQRLKALTVLLRQVAMVILGLMMVLFIGIITIQGVSSSVADGLALRTAKFATATFIPVVGKVFSDTVELVMGASLVLKNAVGIFGVISIGMVCLLPSVKMFAVILIMKFTGALIEPMGDAKMAKCLTELGGSLTLVAGAMLTVTLMFFLVITMIIGTGSAAVMLR